MRTLRKLITGGLEIRASRGIKVRQPLASAELQWSSEFRPDLLVIAQEELNVKAISAKQLDKEDSSGIHLVTDMTPELKREGIMREVVRQVQNARKAAELQVDDRISLVLSSEDEELLETIKEHDSTISQETLASNLNDSGDGAFESLANIDGKQLTIRITKA
jgi:isoleucyl-tRNA synthetase